MSTTSTTTLPGTLGSGINNNNNEFVPGSSGEYNCAVWLTTQLCVVHDKCGDCMLNAEYGNANTLELSLIRDK